MRFSRILALLIVASMLLSACGPAIQTTADEMLPNGQRFLLQLPRLVFDFDNQGNPTLGGYGLSDLEALTGMQMQTMVLNPFYVEWATNTNVQNIELAHTDTGLYIYVNAQLMPHLAWDSESLGTLTSVAGLFLAEPWASLVQKVVPILERTGLGLALTFPMQAGAEAIALRDATVPPQAIAADAVDLTLVTHVDVDYDENGVATLAGISSRELAELGLFVPVELTPETIDLVQGYGVQDFRVISAPGGIFLMVNGAPLPHIAWNTETLGNAVNFYATTNPDSPYIELANLLVPELGNLDIDVAFRFPAG